MTMALFDTLKLALFSGKGGVGKTTLSCSFARHWAETFPTETVLLLSTDPAHSLGDVLCCSVTDEAQPLTDLPNLQVRSLDAQSLLQTFKDQYGQVLELLVERGSFVQGDDLTPVWDLGWPGLDELMGILEIQRILRDRDADRVVVDMAPSGHTLNLFRLMDFLEGFLDALELFQEKHRVISQTFTGRHTADDADRFLDQMKADLATGRQLLQDSTQTACLVVAIAEPMSWLETSRFLTQLHDLKIPCGGIFVNHILPQLIAPSADAIALSANAHRQQSEQSELLDKFTQLVEPHCLFTVPEHASEPIGNTALDRLFDQIKPFSTADLPQLAQPLEHLSLPDKIPPGLHDFIRVGKHLIIVGGKGGVGKTTVSAAIAWGMAERHPECNIRVISIDPAHSLGDALGCTLGHTPINLTPNLSAQEVDAEQVLNRFRDDYLWELADMMSGDNGDDSLKIAYGPEAWRQIVAQALPGIDEMLSLITVMELLEQKQQDLIVLDTAPTGHLLRFLEMPTAMGDWLAWIFKLWIKYQDVVGRTDLMGRLRTLRQRVMAAQKQLKDASYTEFIGVVQAQTAIIAEAQRLSQSLAQMGINQPFVVQNCYDSNHEIEPEQFATQTLIKLPRVPRAIAPQQQIAIAAQLLF